MTVGTGADPGIDVPVGRRTTAAPRGAGRRTARWVGLSVLVIAAGLVAVLATLPSAQTVEAKSPLVGHFAPPIAGATLDGTTYRLPRAPGHYLVVNFFASWCIPCQEEGPELVAFQFRHHRTGAASVLSVVFDDSATAARNYQRELGATWPTMADGDQSIAQDFGVHEDPTSFVIAPDGRVVTSILGGVTARGLDAVIARAEAHGYGR